MKQFLVSALCLLLMVFSAGFSFPSVAYAACPGSGSAEDQVLGGIGESGSNCDTSALNRAITAIVTILSYVAGVAAVIMIIYSGFKYITSAGDSGKVASAKNALIYALVGIAVAVLSQALVNLVLTQANNVQNSCPSGQHRSDDGKKCLKN